MRALTISAHGGLEQLQYRTDLPDPELREPTDVRVRLRAAALNHLDLFVLGGLPGVTITPPWIMGADGAGEIDAVGDEVRGLARGDPVIINPGISDRTCEYCREGEQPLCVRFRLLGEHLPGTIADFIVVPAANVRASAGAVAVPVPPVSAASSSSPQAVTVNAPLASTSAASQRHLVVCIGLPLVSGG